MSGEAEEERYVVSKGREKGRGRWWGCGRGKKGRLGTRVVFVSR